MQPFSCGVCVIYNKVSSLTQLPHRGKKSKNTQFLSFYPLYSGNTNNLAKAQLPLSIQHYRAENFPCALPPAHDVYSERVCLNECNLCFCFVWIMQHHWENKNHHQPTITTEKSQPGSQLGWQPSNSGIHPYIQFMVRAGNKWRIAVVDTCVLIFSPAF